MKRLLVAIALLSGLVFAAPAHAETIREASIVGNKGPYYGAGTCESVTAGPYAINAGDTVRWTNCDSTTHTVSFSGFGSGNRGPGSTYEHLFVASGAFDYKCDIHPDTMKGTIIVTSNVPTSTPATSPPATVAKPSITTVTTTGPTQSTLDLNGAFDNDEEEEQEESTTSASSSSTSTLDELAGASDDSDGGNGLLIFALVLAIAALGGVGVYAVRRMRAS